MTMPKEYDATFTCALGRKWHISFTTSKILKFCKETGKQLEQLLPNELNEAELIELSFLGIQHHADAKGIDYDMWIDTHLEGEAYSFARDATAMGIINFTLPKLPEKTRILLRHTLDDSLKIAGELTKKVEESQEGGLGQT